MTSETETPDPQCGTCGDKHIVSVKIETWNGPMLRDIDCPDCKGGKFNLTDIRDSQILGLQKEQEALAKVVRNIGIAVLCLTVLFVLKAIQEGKTPELIAKVTEIGEPPA